MSKTIKVSGKKISEIMERRGVSEAEALRIHVQEDLGLNISAEDIEKADKIKGPKDLFDLLQKEGISPEEAISRILGKDIKEHLEDMYDANYRYFTRFINDADFESYDVIAFLYNLFLSELHENTEYDVDGIFDFAKNKANNDIPTLIGSTTGKDQLEVLNKLTAYTFALLLNIEKAKCALAIDNSQEEIEKLIKIVSNMSNKE